MAGTATAISGAHGDLASQAAEAQAKPPVERAAATDKIVAEKAGAIAAAVSYSMAAQADLAKAAPAAEAKSEDLASHAQGIMTAVLGDGKNKGLVGNLQKAQAGPTTTALTVANQRS